MKSIQRRFNNFSEKNIGVGDYVIFVRAIKGQKFDKKTISRWFSKLVEKSDYDNKSRKTLLKGLLELSNSVEKSLRKTYFEQIFSEVYRKEWNLKRYSMALEKMPTNDK